MRAKALGLILRRPEVDHSLTESALSRARREFHSLVTNTVRFSLWAGFCTIASGAVGAWLSWNHGKGATVGLGAGAAILGLAFAFALPFCWLWWTAPVVQRGELRDALDAEREESRRKLQAERDRFDEAGKSYRDSFDGKGRETEDLRGQLGKAEAQIRLLEARIEAMRNARPIEPARIREAALVIRSELQGVEVMLDPYIRSLEGLPHDETIHYAKVFRLPTIAWETHGGDLAGDASLFVRVRPAYGEITRLHTILDWRETGARNLIGVNRQDDDLPRVREAARGAIHALDELIEDSVGST